MNRPITTPSPDLPGHPPPPAPAPPGPQGGAHAYWAPWPYARLDVEAARAHGHVAWPIRQFVLKTRSRCNLACTYCYVYAMADQGWREQPVVMTAATAARAARRIAEHAAAHDLPRVDLVLHGGEPLLTAPAALAAPVRAVREALAAASPRTRLTATVQTNGTLLTRGRLAALAAAGIRVGVSLDGGLPAHNTRRVDHAGRPGFGAAARGLRLLARHPDSYAGVLCVVDLAQDPVETYESLLAFDPPSLGLLLPLGHWSAPPPGHHPGRTPYADWLLAVFERWWHDGVRRTRIRLFEEIIALLLGLPATTETLGLAPAATAVIETDGSIEQADSLKSAYEGAAATGMALDTHSFDQLLDHPGFAARQLGRDALAPVCRGCALVEVCGGGHYPHRYRAGEGFRQPSVYCADLQALIRHIAAAVRRAATAAAGATTAAAATPAPVAAVPRAATAATATTGGVAATPTPGGGQPADAVPAPSPAAAVRRAATAAAGATSAAAAATPAPGVGPVPGRPAAAVPAAVPAPLAAVRRAATTAAGATAAAATPAPGGGQPAGAVPAPAPVGPAEVLPAAPVAPVLPPAAAS